MRRLLLAMAGCIIFVSPALAEPECWGVKEFKGTSLMSDEGYKHNTDRLPNPVVVCFHEETGVVTGNDIPLLRMGHSTLAGMSDNGKGGETMVVYQLNRGLKKMLLLQTRVGTESIMPLLPDTAMVGGRCGSHQMICRRLGMRESPGV